MPGVATPVELSVCSRGPWHASFLSSSRGFVGSRVVSALSTVPKLVLGPCVRRESRGEAA
jgi:hypothetical protein